MATTHEASAVQQQPYPQTVIPHLTVSDGNAAIDFYKRAFNAQEVRHEKHQDGKRVMHSELRFYGGVAMVNDDFPEYMNGVHRAPEPNRPAAVTIHLSVPDVDAAYNLAVSAGAKGTMEPRDMFWGDRYARIQDPFGHEWAFGAPIKK